MTKRKAIWIFILIAASLIVPLKNRSAEAVTYAELTGGTASSSSYYSTYKPEYAFDSSSTTFWIAGSCYYHYPSSWYVWLQYKLKTATIVNKYSIQVRHSGCYYPIAWKLYGSNNGSTWTTLDTRSGITSWGTTETKTFTFSNSTKYLYYRLVVTKTQYTYKYTTCYTYYFLHVKIAELNLYGPKPNVSLTASPTTISTGGSSTLTWSSSLANSVSINQGIGTVSTSGTKSVSPTSNTTYTLTATNGAGSTTKTATVNLVPTATFTRSPTSIVCGTSSTLSWSTTNATSISINQDVGTVSASGSTSVSPMKNTTYTLTATGPGGTVTKSLTVYVILDSDNDGIPDWYEITEYGDLDQDETDGYCICE